MNKYTVAIIMSFIFSSTIAGYCVYLNTQISNLYDNLHEFQAQLVEKDFQIINLHNSINVLRQQLAANSTIIADLQNRTFNLESQVSVLQEQIQYLRTHIVILQQQSGCLQVAGVCYSPYRDGQDPIYGPLPTTDQIKDDMNFLKGITNRIRTYSSIYYPISSGYTDVYDSIPSLVKPFGLSVYQGVLLRGMGEESPHALHGG